MAFFGVRLSDDLAVRFDAFASSRGGRSKLLRQMIETILRSGGSTAPSALEPEARARGRSEKVTIRLRDEDLAALDTACRAAGLRRTEWVVGLVRRRLLRRPQLNRAEAQALLDIRRDLRRIGVNLNQAVHALHSGAGEGTASARELLAFRQEVRAQLEGVRAALEGDLSYWAGEER
jgi:metal-responsive CopG/Arc/MetJ family transcriptional regulator